jgi:pyrroline-5-carboxylate reductase
MKYKIGFIGVGVMAGAILKSTLKNLFSLGIAADEIAVYDLDADKLKEFKKNGVSIVFNKNVIFESSEIVMLGVKPQSYADVFINTVPIKARVLVSIMAGVKIASLKKVLPQNIGVVRAMPNSPALIGKGVTALCFNNVSAQDATFIQKLFEFSGKTVVVDEDKFDAVTSVSGSGPAYVFLFADALIKGGIDGGLTENEAKTLALKTIEGAACLATESDKTLNELASAVCSKGGTTIEAVNYFNKNNFEKIIKDAVEACRLRSKELGADQ